MFGAPSLLPVPSLMSAAPTTTWRGTGTTTITSPQAISKTAVRQLGPTAVHASGYIEASPDAGMAMPWDMYVNAPVIDLRVLRFNSKFNVFVDNAPISGSAFTTTSDGQPDLLTLDFSALANPTATKRLKVFGINMLENGFYIGPTYSAWPPTNNNKIAAILGDSYTQGTGATSVGETWARFGLSALGYDIFPEGIGGAGYLTTGTTAPDTRMTARLGAMPVGPDLIVLALGYNDSAGSQSTIATNHVATVAAARAAWPNARIVTLGPWTPLGATANLTTTKNTLATSSSSVGVDFIDIENIINSTNAVAFGNGDNVHPNAAGHQYLGNQIAQRMLYRHLDARRLAA